MDSFLDRRCPSAHLLSQSSCSPTPLLPRKTTDSRGKLTVRSSTNPPRPRGPADLRKCEVDLAFTTTVWTPQTLLAKDYGQCDINQGLANFSYEELDGKLFYFLGHTVSVATTQVCHSSAKAAIDDTQTRGMAVFQKTFIYKTGERL